MSNTDQTPATADGSDVRSVRATAPAFPVYAGRCAAKYVASSPAKVGTLTLSLDALLFP